MRPRKIKRNRVRRTRQAWAIRQWHERAYEDPPPRKWKAGLMRLS